MFKDQEVLANPMYPAKSQTLVTVGGRRFKISEMSEPDVCSTYEEFNSAGIQPPDMLSERYYKIKEENS